MWYAGPVSKKSPQTKDLQRKLDELIGSVLTEARHGANRTLHDAADMLGVHRKTVANYEAGSTPAPLSAVVRLLRLYGQKLDLRPLEATLAALDEQHAADTLHRQLREDLSQGPQGLEELARGRDASAVALALAALVARGDLEVRGRGSRRVYSIVASS